MPHKIDLYDKNLLYSLDRNAHCSISELARDVRRSKQFVLFRMKKLQREGIITGYHAIIDMSKLGYFTFRVYLKFQQVTEEEGNEFAEQTKNSLSRIWTITKMYGKWDYALFLGVKTINEFHEVWDKMMLSYKGKIKSYNVSVYAPIYNFNRKFFLKKNEFKEKERLVRVYGIGEKERVDGVDEKLIKIYASNVRQSSLEIAKKLKVSPDTVRNRIKKLEKKKIFIGYKIGLNPEELGFVSYRIDLQLISTKRNKELFNYCFRHSDIYQINKTIGGADFEIEVVVKDFQCLIRLIDEIRTKFKDVVNDVDYFGFSTFHILQYIPD